MGTSILLLAYTIYAQILKPLSAEMMLSRSWPDVTWVRLGLIIFRHRRYRGARNETDNLMLNFEIYAGSSPVLLPWLKTRTGFLLL